MKTTTQNRKHLETAHKTEKSKCYALGINNYKFYSFKF